MLSTYLSGKRNTIKISFLLWTEHRILQLRGIPVQVVPDLSVGACRCSDTVPQYVSCRVVFMVDFECRLVESTFPLAIPHLDRYNANVKYPLFA